MTHTAPPILVIMLDGLGDRPWPILGGLTPLAAADTPNLDAFAAASATGVLNTLGPGRAPGTDLAHFVLFGYPESTYPGRGVLEALGAGVTLQPHQVVMHAIFVTVSPTSQGTLEIIERYPRADPNETAQMANRIAEFEQGGLRVNLTHTGGEEAIVTVSSSDGATQPSPDITDTDPHNNGWLAGSVKPLDSAANWLAASTTARTLNAYLRFVYEALAPSDASQTERPFLLLKWVAEQRPVPSFRAQTGMRGHIVSSSRIFEGLGKLLDMRHERVPSLPNLAKDTSTRLEAGIQALNNGAEFVLVHQKAPDVAGHSKDPVAKRDVLAAIDRGLGGLAKRKPHTADGHALSSLPPGTIVVITGDHGTPAGTELIHSGDPVSLAILADAIAPDEMVSFDERACARGVFGHVSGSDFMPIALNARGTVRYTGGRLSEHTGLHWPRDYEPFKVE